MGQRANFEEQYSGETFLGNYVAGVYYPDKTRVGWWKNGYPQYFAKVLNAANWIGLHIEINGAPLDLHTWKVHEFNRELDMQHGVYTRTFKASHANGTEVSVTSTRFYSLVNDASGALNYEITCNKSAEIKVTPFVDFDIKNHDSNYDKKFWKQVAIHTEENMALIQARTKKSGFEVCTGTLWQVKIDTATQQIKAKSNTRKKYAEHQFTINVEAGKTVNLIKYGCNISSENHPAEQLQKVAIDELHTLSDKGFETLLAEQKNAWLQKWHDSDIQITGDVKAQQAIRFNIFMLNQTYTGEDDRLNIGPKGFTGEKYGGATYWDTEAYCLPFYLSMAPQKVAKQLLIYRYKQLDKAIENAKMLGFTGGAALYPMVTMNGEECHNEWEITFEEIHRNGAIAYGIHRYIEYTGDKEYLGQYGMEVLVAIARFWAQRVNYSQQKQQYVMLGVTGPNEYENNINNNWYTSYIAMWCLKYAQESLAYVKANNADRYQQIITKIGFSDSESEQWDSIQQNMYLPEDKALGIFLQQDNFLDKEQVLASELSASERPINQYWSWDRILRSCFIKQADVLQGFYFFEDDFTEEQHQKNFDFYEPRTVHESSLSPCVHSILAAKLGRSEQAYEFYLRTARLDLDDYNAEVHEGLHITSMAGTWMSVVEGFGGMRVKNNALHFAPQLPQQWHGMNFTVRFRDNIIKLNVATTGTSIQNVSGPEITVFVNNNAHQIASNGQATI